MPGLSGSDRAYRYAYLDESDLGRTRLDSTRLGCFPQNRVPVTINGTATNAVMVESITIDLNTGEEPHRATFRMVGGTGLVPTAGMQVTINHGSTANRLFAGRVRTTRVTYRRNDEKRPTYDVECVGWVFDIDISRVQRGFSVSSLSVRSIVGFMFVQTEPQLGDLGFSYEHVSADLPIAAQLTVSPIEPVSQVLDRLFRSVDATWYVDQYKRIFAFGSINAVTGGTPATLTSTTSVHWGISYRAMDLSRVFANVQVIGAGQTTLVDFLPSVHQSVAIDSGANLVDSLNASFGQTEGSTSHLFGHEARYYFASPAEDQVQAPDGHMRAGQVSVFLPASAQANTLTVVAANVNSVSPLTEQRWYQVAGQYVYVASVIGAYSLTVNTLAYSYHIPKSIPGAITTDIQAGGEIAPLWNYIKGSSFASSLFPAGTAIKTFVSIMGNSPVASLVPEYGVYLEDAQYWTRTFDDNRLSPAGARQVASEAMARGAVSAWPHVMFQTRDRYVDLGRPAYVALASIAEPSANAVSGTFTVHDVAIEFGRLAEGRGPIRSVTLGAIRRPSLWQVLQGVS